MTSALPIVAACQHLHRSCATRGQHFISQWKPSPCISHGCDSDQSAWRCRCNASAQTARKCSAQAPSRTGSDLLAHHSGGTNGGTWRPAGAPLNDEIIQARVPAIQNREGRNQAGTAGSNNCRTSARQWRDRRECSFPANPSIAWVRSDRDRCAFGGRIIRAAWRPPP